MDFESGLLPTLDFQTRVRGDWEIEYTYFSKPMASGLVIQKGTALSNQTVFASLRQDLIRRLSHISDHFQVEEHEKIINTFTQNLVDSGHRYLFIRAIILQALTRFKYIKERNVLDESDARYNPMHRDRWYKFEERSKIKLTSKALWYTNMQVGDVYKQDWKRRIKRKGDDKNPHHKNNSLLQKYDNITTVMFVPSTPNGDLLRMLEELEGTLAKQGEFSWGIKLVEKAGKPLSLLFLNRSPVELGCPLNSGASMDRNTSDSPGLQCRICDNDTIKCSPSNLVYEARCDDCTGMVGDKTSVLEGKVNVSKVFKYIGESSRPFRMRAKEHWDKLEALKPESFMLSHWMLQHGTQMLPPNFSFKLVGKYGDCLSRQLSEALYIEEFGNLNRKSEYTNNHISRLEAGLSDREKCRMREQEAYERANFISNITNFANVIRSVRNKNNITPNLGPTCRKRSTTAQQLGAAGTKRLRRMETSTPAWREPKSLTVNIEEVSPIYRINKDSPGQTSNSADQGNRSEIEMEQQDLGHTGLSPKVRKMLIKPKNEDEFLELRRLVIETVNLTRAAMMKGLIVEDELNQMEKLEENSLYKPFKVAEDFSLSHLMNGLNLDEWEKEDIYITFGIERSSSNRSGILSLVETSDENNAGHYSSSVSFLDLGAMAKEKEGLPEVVLPENSSRKRKELSPYGETQVARALKLHKGNSPVLRERSSLTNTTPRKRLGAVFTPPTQNRKIRRPRRCPNPDKKQLLITSSFSPRARTNAEDGLDGNNKE